jgi:hypothetical protein
MKQPSCQENQGQLSLDAGIVDLKRVMVANADGIVSIRPPP